MIRQKTATGSRIRVRTGTKIVLGSGASFMVAPARQLLLRCALFCMLGSKILLASGWSLHYQLRVFNRRAGYSAHRACASISRRRCLASMQASSSSATTTTTTAPLRKVIVVAGPTGSGKSDVAAQICAAMNGIIVSADSVQAYKKVQIGANKPDAAELARTPHILVDVADHTQNYNAAAWRRDAIFVIRHLLMMGQSVEEDVAVKVDDEAPLEDAARRSAILETIHQAKEAKKSVDGGQKSFSPVVVGGTMMYLQWLVHGQPDAVRPTDGALRLAKDQVAGFESDNDWTGAVEQVRSQGEVFAQQVQKLSGHDWYRLRRILEVAYTVREKQDDTLIEKLYSGLREGGLSSFGYDVRCFFLCPDDRMKHSKVVDRRCEDMICRGLLNETTNLVLAGEMPDMASRAIGYRQSLDYLERENPNDSDEDAFAEYLAQFTASTRQYSKKQMQWFRRDDEFVFVSVPLEEDKSERVKVAAEEVARLIALPRTAYDEERLSATSASGVARETNAAQAKGMKVYQFQKQILKPGSKELREAVAEADNCTHRFQAKKPRHEKTLASEVL